MGAKVMQILWKVVPRVKY